MTQRIRYEVPEKSIVAASHTVMNSGTLPHRIVLRDEGQQYITHIEILAIRAVGDCTDADGNPDTIQLHHMGFENGHYFRYDRLHDEGVMKAKADKAAAFKLAKADYDERVKGL